MKISPLLVTVHICSVLCIKHPKTKGQQILTTGVLDDFQAHCASTYQTCCQRAHFSSQAAAHSCPRRRVCSCPRQTSSSAKQAEGRHRSFDREQSIRPPNTTVIKLVQLKAKGMIDIDQDWIKDKNAITTNKPPAKEYS